MTNYSVKNVDEYIEASPQEARPHLRELRKIVSSALPGAEEKLATASHTTNITAGLQDLTLTRTTSALKFGMGFPARIAKNLKARAIKTGSVTLQIRYDQQVPAVMISKLIKAQAKLNEVKVIADDI